MASWLQFQRHYYDFISKVTNYRFDGALALKPLVPKLLFGGLSSGRRPLTRSNLVLVCSAFMSTSCLFKSCFNASEFAFADKNPSLEFSKECSRVLLFFNVKGCSCLTRNDSGNVSVCTLAGILFVFDFLSFFA